MYGEGLGTLFNEVRCAKYGKVDMNRRGVFKKKIALALEAHGLCQVVSSMYVSDPSCDIPEQLPNILAALGY